MKDLTILAVLLILLLLVVLVGIRTEGFLPLTPASVQAYEPPQGRDECVQGLYKCANQRIPFGF
jgi:hypothetical protein